ncbi:alpha/beta fold hydrolase [Ammoniphilus resinae]|uniref:Pimeloyl-ACP methyl ester carboxylesterase n=1 Tax=Ammoniphilus resinae TaxID=861532 RepID=A0ABS4GSM9_9BACL|nr:alpha/beta fold hydrolase [Ammoniphilus resinae]MBP1933283.1 pimeloyl-ACP methyl ester carboxylesterase [Ammoniphilus resinae]
MPFSTREGISIHYHTEGVGTPIIFLHSLGTNHNIWDDQFNAFKSDYNVIGFDFKGHGESGKKLPFTIENAMLDAKHIMDLLEISEAHIVGISLGGHVAMKLYEQVPNRVKSLTLADTWAYVPPHLRVERTNNRIGRLQSISIEQFCEELAVSSIALGAESKTIEKLRALMNFSKDTYISAWDAVHSVDFRELLKTIHVPVLVMVGDQDKSSPLSYAEEITTQIEKAKLEIIPNAGHLSHLTNVPYFNQKLREFLGGNK